jgi:hypothetical protein
MNEPTTDKQIARYRGKIHGLSSAAETAITNLQPYKLPSASRQDYPIAVLHELNIIDKHRVVLVVAGSLNTVGFGVGSKPGQTAHIDVFDTEKFRVMMELKDGAEIGYALGDAAMKVNIQASFNIAFPKIGATQFKPVAPSLQELRDFVVEVVDAFERDLFL